MYLLGGQEDTELAEETGVVREEEEPEECYGNQRRNCFQEGKRQSATSEAERS